MLIPRHLMNRSSVFHLPGAMVGTRPTGAGALLHVSSRLPNPRALPRLFRLFIFG